MVIHSNIMKSCLRSVCQFECQFENTICNYDFGPRAFVLVWNSSVGMPTILYMAMAIHFTVGIQLQAVL
jgi:hypothetical protein